MPAHRRRGRSLASGGSAAYDQHFLLLVSFTDQLFFRATSLAADPGVDCAFQPERPVFQHGARADIGTNAGPDLHWRSCPGFLHYAWIGDMGARHSDKIDRFILQNLLSLLKGANTPCGNSWNTRYFQHRANGRQHIANGFVHRSDNFGKVVKAAHGNVEEVDAAHGLEMLHQPHSFSRVDSAGRHLGTDPYPQREAG